MNGAMILLALVAAAGWALATILYVVFPGRQRRKELQLTHTLRSRVEPFLRRRIEELGLDGAPPATSPADDPEEVLEAMEAMVQLVKDCERVREQVALEDTLNVGICETQDLERSNK